MDGTTVLVSFGIAVVASLATTLGTYWLQRHNYKQEYYKKLLDKRLAAYETVQLLVDQLLGTVRVNDEQVSAMICAHGKERLDDCITLMINAKNNSIWLSDAINLHLRNFNVIMMEKLRPPGSQSDDQSILQAGIDHHLEILELGTELTLQTMDDLETLHQITGFLDRPTVKRQEVLDQLKQAREQHGINGEEPAS